MKISQHQFDLLAEKHVSEAFGKYPPKLIESTIQSELERQGIQVVAVTNDLYDKIANMAMSGATVGDVVKELCRYP